MFSGNVEFDVRRFEKQLFIGYDINGLELLKRSRVRSCAIEDGVFVDWFGVKYHPEMVSHFDQNVFGRLIPFPNDGHLAESLEYVSALTALELSPGPIFNMAELGAGWGPWTATGTRMAKNAGKTDIYCVAVEASGAKIPALKRHLVLNGVRPDDAAMSTLADGVECRLLEGAAWHEDATLYFPKAVSMDDYGAAVSTTKNEKDYRLLNVEHEPVTAYGLESILEERDVFDFVHIDIQGAELELIENTIDILAGKVRCFYVGTHSRQIESQLVELLRHRDFFIKWEKPCKVYWGIYREDIRAQTEYDGGQLWVNRRLV